MTGRRGRTASVFFPCGFFPPPIASLFASRASSPASLEFRCGASILFALWFCFYLSLLQIVELGHMIQIPYGSLLSSFPSIAYHGVA